MRSSFAGAEKRSGNEKPAGNTLCIDKGFEAVVDGNLDYGNTFYVRLRFDSKEGDVKYLFLKSDKAYDLGTKLHIEFDLTRSQITETDMNIRLY